MSAPRVSVLMPVHNGMPFVPEAVESVLHQSYVDFELVIVNDCSTDGTKAYLDSLTDPRVNLIHLTENKGVTGALQAGLDAVRGELIARLDADDVAYPNRLEEQVRYMELHPTTGLLASYAQMMDEQGRPVKNAIQKLKSEIDLRWELLFKNPIIHSTVMLRREVLRKNGLTYVLPHGEDYDLWIRMAKVTGLAILPLPLIKYRVNSGSWTYTKASEQMIGAREVSARAIRSLTDMPDDSMDRIRRWVRVGGRLSSVDQTFFDNLLAAFLKANAHARSAAFYSRLWMFLRRRLGWRVWYSRRYWLLFLPVRNTA